MNVERMLKLADIIERGEPLEVSGHRVGFNMKDFFDEDEHHADRTGHGCETTACIAGWAAIIGFPREFDETNTQKLAQRYLDIDDFEGAILFLGVPLLTLVKDVTPAQAARALRRMARGENPWG